MAVKNNYSIIYIYNAYISYLSNGFAGFAGKYKKRHLVVVKHIRSCSFSIVRRIKTQFKYKMKFFVVFFTLCAVALAAPSPQLLTYAAGSPYYSQHLIGAPLLQHPSVATPLLAKRLDGKEAPASTVHADHVASAPILSKYNFQ